MHSLTYEMLPWDLPDITDIVTVNANLNSLHIIWPWNRDLSSLVLFITNYKFSFKIYYTLNNILYVGI